MEPRHRVKRDVAGQAMPGVLDGVVVSQVPRLVRDASPHPLPTPLGQGPATAIHRAPNTTCREPGGERLARTRRPLVGMQALGRSVAKGLGQRLHTTWHVHGE